MFRIETKVKQSVQGRVSNNPDITSASAFAA
jgi:hypothetical protein